MRRGYRNRRGFNAYVVTQDRTRDTDEDSDVLIVYGAASKTDAKSALEDRIRWFNMLASISNNLGMRGWGLTKIVTGTELRKAGVDPNNDLNWASPLLPFDFGHDYTREQIRQIDSIASSNAGAAFDMVREHGSLEESLQAHWDNALDTLAEEKFSPQNDDRFQIAVLAIAEATGVDLSDTSFKYVPREEG